MPIVTVDPNDFERFLLKTAPANPEITGDEDGYVMLRPLPYGMKLVRSDKALRMTMRANQGAQDRQVKRANAEQTIDLETAQEWTTHYDYAYCIGDHNLTDKNGTVLDFAKPMALKLLHPKVGAEITSLIDSLNEDENEESAEDLVRRAFTSSEEELSLSSSDSGTPPVLPRAPDLSRSRDSLTEEL